MRLDSKNGSYVFLEPIFVHCNASVAEIFRSRDRHNAVSPVYKCTLCKHVVRYIVPLLEALSIVTLNF